MITFHIISLFPEAFKSFFSVSLIKRAQKNKLVRIKFYNPRDFTKDKYRTVDDKPYGGGPGMVMKLEPLVRAVLSVLNDVIILNDKKTTRTIRTIRTKIILLSPNGKQFNQKMAREWAKKNKNIVLICGHYEGVDERLKKVLQGSGFPGLAKRSGAGKVQEISIGPYILSGGEAGAMVLVDAISRHIPGVLGKIESLEEKKGSYSVFTRPEVFKYGNKKYAVPKVLLSGNHKKISEWRRKYGKII